MPWKAHISSIVTIGSLLAGMLIMFGWFKKTITNNEERIKKLEKQDPVTALQCQQTQDRLVHAIEKVEIKIDKTSEFLNSQVLANKSASAAEYREVIRSIGRLEGIIDVQKK